MVWSEVSILVALFAGFLVFRGVPFDCAKGRVFLFLPRLVIAGLWVVLVFLKVFYGVFARLRQLVG